MNTRLNASIYSLAYGGCGVGKVEGKVYFVEGALPEEEVVFDVISDHQRYATGKVVEIVRPSKHRIEPVCPYYGRCGGCQLQHVSYEKELCYKREQVMELVRRISGRKDFAYGDVVSSEDCYGYRSSVTLHRKDASCGFYGQNSRDIVNISDCPVTVPSLSAEIAALSHAEGKESVTLKADHAGRVWSSERAGERFFPDRYMDQDIYMSPKVFSQPNRGVAVRITDEFLAWAGEGWEDAVFFDVYCGTGFFSFLIGKCFSSCVGIDSNRIAIDCAKRTSKDLPARRCRFYRGSADGDFFRLFDTYKKKKNIVLLDPPRTGVPGKMLERLKGIRDIDRLYYLSCDPAHLARDIRVLTCGSAWSLSRITSFDMFPRTKHIETLAEFIPC